MAGELALQNIGVPDTNLDETSQLIDLKKRDTVHLTADSLDDKADGVSPSNEPGNNSTTSSNGRELVCVLIAVGAAMAAVVCAGAIQSLHESVPHAELNLGRFIFVPFILLPFIVRRRCDLRVERRRLRWMFPACVALYIGNLLYYGSYYYLPLGNATVCVDATRIVVLVVASLVVHEFSIASIVGGLVCIASLVLVVQPEFVFGIHESGNVTIDCFSICLNDRGLSAHMNGSSDLTILGGDVPRRNHDHAMNCTKTPDLLSTATNGYFQPELKGYMMAVGGGFLLGLIILMYNRPLRDVDPVVLGFWTSLFGIFTATGQMLLTETPTLPDCWFCLTMFALHALLVGAESVVYIILNQKTTRPLVVAITLVSIKLPLNFILQYTLLSAMYPGHRNWAEYLGIALCLVGLLLGPVYQLAHPDKNGKNMKRSTKSSAD